MIADVRRSCLGEGTLRRTAAGLVTQVIAGSSRMFALFPPEKCGSQDTQQARQGGRSVQKVIGTVCSAMVVVVSRGTSRDQRNGCPPPNPKCMALICDYYDCTMPACDCTRGALADGSAPTLSRHSTGGLPIQSAGADGMARIGEPRSFAECPF